MAGFDVKKRPREFFLVFIGFILFSVSLYTTVFIIFSGSDKRTVPASAPRLQRRWHDLTHLQGLVTDLHNELSEAVAERDDLEIQLKQILETDDGKHIARWTNIIRPLKSRLPPRLRNKPLLSCAHIDAIQAVSRTAIGSSKIVQRALYGAKEVLVKSLNPDGKSVRNCMGKMTVGQCLTFASYRLLREMSLLADLQNDNVVEVNKALIVCVLSVCLSVLEGNGGGLCPSGRKTRSREGTPWRGTFSCLAGCLMFACCVHDSFANLSKIFEFSRSYSFRHFFFIWLCK